MTDRPPEWSVRCPWCNAAPGQRCTSRARGRRLTGSHDARHQAHTSQTATEEDQP
ncbi:zinc finger domain-containing protein [Streptomyces antibioticus]